MQNISNSLFSTIKKEDLIFKENMLSWSSLADKIRDFFKLKFKLTSSTKNLDLKNKAISIKNDIKKCNEIIKELDNALASNNFKNIKDHAKSLRKIQAEAKKYSDDLKDVGSILKGTKFMVFLRNEARQTPEPDSFKHSRDFNQLHKTIEDRLQNLKFLDNLEGSKNYLSTIQYNYKLSWMYYGMGDNSKTGFKENVSEIYSRLEILKAYLKTKEQDDSYGKGEDVKALVENINLFNKEIADQTKIPLPPKVKAISKPVSQKDIKFTEDTFAAHFWNFMVEHRKDPDLVQVITRQVSSLNKNELDEICKFADSKLQNRQLSKSVVKTLLECLASKDLLRKLDSTILTPNLVALCDLKDLETFPEHFWDMMLNNAKDPNFSLATLPIMNKLNKNELNSILQFVDNKYSNIRVPVSIVKSLVSALSSKNLLCHLTQETLTDNLVKQCFELKDINALSAEQISYFVKVTNNGTAKPDVDIRKGLDFGTNSFVTMNLLKRAQELNLPVDTFLKLNPQISITDLINKSILMMNGDEHLYINEKGDLELLDKAELLTRANLKNYTPITKINLLEIVSELKSTGIPDNVKKEIQQLQDLLQMDKSMERIAKDALLDNSIMNNFVFELKNVLLTCSRADTRPTNVENRLQINGGVPIPYWRLLKTIDDLEKNNWFSLSDAQVMRMTVKNIMMNDFPKQNKKIKQIIHFNMSNYIDDTIKEKLIKLEKGYDYSKYQDLVIQAGMPKMEKFATDAQVYLKQMNDLIQKLNFNYKSDDDLKIIKNLQKQTSDYSRILVIINNDPTKKIADFPELQNTIKNDPTKNIANLADLQQAIKDNEVKVDTLLQKWVEFKKIENLQKEILEKTVELQDAAKKNPEDIANLANLQKDIDDSTAKVDIMQQKWQASFGILTEKQKLAYRLNDFAEQIDRKTIQCEGNYLAVLNKKDVKERQFAFGKLRFKQDAELLETLILPCLKLLNVHANNFGLKTLDRQTIIDKINGEKGIHNYDIDMNPFFEPEKPKPSSSK